MRVVFDTNIYISALLFPNSTTSNIFKIAREKNSKLFISEFILFEIKSKLIEKFEIPESYADLILFEIRKSSHTIKPKVRMQIIKTDTKDNRILECALAAKADYLVTGDKKHILPLGKINECKIVSAKEFMGIIEQLHN